MATPQEHRVGELMRSFLEHDGLQEVHSFEKAWTIRDAEGNEVELEPMTGKGGKVAPIPSEEETVLQTMSGTPLSKEAAAGDAVVQDVGAV